MEKAAIGARRVTVWSSKVYWGTMLLWAAYVGACGGPPASEEELERELQGIGGSSGTGVGGGAGAGPSGGTGATGWWFVELQSGNDTHLVENDLANYATQDRVSVRGDGSGTSAVMVGLVKWPVPNLVGSCLVTSATISLNVRSTSNQSYKLYPAVRSWTDGSANWWATGNNENWQIAGAMGLGDRGGFIAEFLPNQIGWKTIVLGPSGVLLVQSWVNDPLNNNKGIIVGHETHGDNFTFASFQYSQSWLRPLLIFRCN